MRERRTTVVCALSCAALTAIGVATSLLVAPVAAAKDSRVVDFDSEPASHWLGTRYYGVYRGDARVGWLRRSLERVEWNERPAVQRTVESFVSIAGDGNARRSEERIVYLLDDPQLLVEIERKVETQGRVGGRRAVRRDGRFDVVTTRDGEETTGAVAALSVMLGDELVSERAVSIARERAESAGGAEDAGDAEPIVVAGVGLDLTRMRLIKRIVSVRGTATAADGGTHYLVSLATGPETWSEPVVVDGDGSVVRGDFTGGLTIRRLTEQEALSTIRLTSVEVAERIRMNAKLGDLQTLRELKVSMPAPAEGAIPPFPVTGRQTVETREGRLYLHVRATEDAGEVTDVERMAALAPSPGIDSDAPEIVSTVDRVLVGSSRPAVRIVRLLEFTAQHIEDSVVMDEPSASELLRHGRGDCTEHTRLFIALARAAGIPAREVSGVIWIDDEQQTFGWHAWAEVELNGHWRPVDPTGGVTPAHAAHIRIDPAARIAGTLAGERFELESAVR